MTPEHRAELAEAEANLLVKSLRRLEAENEALRSQLSEAREALRAWQAWLDHFEPCGPCREALAWCPEWYRLQDVAIAANRAALSPREKP